MGEPLQRQVREIKTSETNGVLLLQSDENPSNRGGTQVSTLSAPVQRRSSWQIGRWCFGTGLVLGFFHGWIWDAISFVLPIV